VLRVQPDVIFSARTIGIVVVVIIIITTIHNLSRFQYRLVRLHSVPRELEHSQYQGNLYCVKGQEVVMVYFKMLPNHTPGLTEENNVSPQSG
jgi:hypothetical protein